MDSNTLVEMNLEKTQKSSIILDNKIIEGIAKEELVKELKLLIQFLEPDLSKDEITSLSKARSIFDFGYSGYPETSFRLKRINIFRSIKMEKTAERIKKLYAIYYKYFGKERYKFDTFKQMLEKICGSLVDKGEIRPIFYICSPTLGDETSFLLDLHGWPYDELYTEFNSIGYSLLEPTEFDGESYSVYLVYGDSYITDYFEDNESYNDVTWLLLDNAQHYPKSYLEDGNVNPELIKSVVEELVDYSIGNYAEELNKNSEFQKDIANDIQNYQKSQYYYIKEGEFKKLYNEACWETIADTLINYPDLLKEQTITEIKPPLPSHKLSMQLLSSLIRLGGKSDQNNLMENMFGKSVGSISDFERVYFKQAMSELLTGIYIQIDLETKVLNITERGEKYLVDTK